ncbi:unnamed protein product [Gordionus sp. m RMFG-2023]
MLLKMEEVKKVNIIAKAKLILVINIHCLNGMTYVERYLKLTLLSSDAYELPSIRFMFQVIFIDSLLMIQQSP